MTLKRASKSSTSSPRSKGLGALVLLGAWCAAAAVFVFAQGWTLYYGDAEAHLNIARRIVDSRLAGYHQIGTVWLPLPHLLMLPLAASGWLWRTGIAGVVPSVLCFVAAGWLMYLAVRRMFASEAAGWAALAVFALNPNALYLQSAPMTEALALCCAAALLYCCARFRESGSMWDAAAAGVAACCGTLTRYEAWFLLPFAAGFFLLYGGERKWRAAAVFSMVAGLGPLYWLGHNWVLYSDPLEFYGGEWSARAIYQRSLDAGMARYPGDHDWAKAWQYYKAAAVLCIGTPLAWLGLAGFVAACVKRAWWAAALLALTPAFYVLSLYSSGTPIYVPQLWPNSWYNTRYGLNALPLAALGVGSLVALMPGRLRGTVAVVLAVAAVSPWVAYPRKETWVCWKESQVNSAGRRTWTRAAAAYLEPRYRAGAGILLSFGDATGVLRMAGIPIREALHEGDLALFEAPVARPDLFLREEWAIAIRGDRVSRAMNKMRRGARRYECVRTYAEKDSPVIEIWRHIQ